MTRLSVQFDSLFTFFNERFPYEMAEWLTEWETKIEGEKEE